MIDEKGYPEFGLEKALSTPYYPNILDRYESSKLWYGEIAFKSRQGFLSIRSDGQPKFFLYGCRTLPVDLGNIAHKIKKMDLPPYTIFEAELLNYEQKKLIITDILLYDNKIINKISIERRKLVAKLIKNDKSIWLPLSTDSIKDDFQKMLLHQSCLIKKAALNYGIPHAQILGLIAGIICKRKDARLFYPKHTRFDGEIKFKLLLD